MLPSVRTVDVIVSTAFTSNKNDFKLGAAARKMTFLRSIFASCTGAGDSSSIVCCISGIDVSDCCIGVSITCSSVVLSAADVGTVSDDGKSVVASGVCSDVVLSCSCVCVVASEDILSLEVAFSVVVGSLDSLSVVAFSLEVSSIEETSTELSSVDFSSVDSSSVVSSSFASQTVSFSSKLLPYDASHAAGSFIQSSAL